MNFWIQVGNPSLSGEFCNEDESLCEAIQSVYPILTEHALLNWNGVFIPMSYKNDLSIMVDDILYLMYEFQSTNHGQVSLSWPSNTFSSDWEISWNGDDLKIISREWHDTLGNIIQLLNLPDYQELNVSLSDFVNEWHGILNRLFDDLARSGYTEDNLPDLSRLRATEQLRVGALYAN
jgi:hypothetical protein